MGLPVRKLLDHPTLVFLTIENRLVRETLVRLFRKRTDVEVLGQCSPAEAPDLPDSRCEIVVLDDLNAASVLGARLLVEGPAASSVGLVLIGMEEEDEQFSYRDPIRGIGLLAE